ncbi:MAG TPA: NUDIX domain-containing protein [Candidatus Saccharimonadales bacterium]|nr:NUDIX domain-containing protein [Candidatus Saccharimonadales bacterium]
MNMKLAGCIIENEHGGILLLHRQTTKRQQWEIPGGKVETGELLAEAAIREIEEELGVRVTIEKLLGKKDFREDDRIMQYNWYSAKIIHGKPKIMEPETFDGLRYFSPVEMRKLFDELSPNAQNFINFLKAG